METAVKSAKISTNYRMCKCMHTEYQVLNVAKIDNSLSKNVLHNVLETIINVSAT